MHAEELRLKEAEKTLAVKLELDGILCLSRSSLERPLYGDLTGFTIGELREAAARLVEKGSIRLLRWPRETYILA